MNKDTKFKKGNTAAEKWTEKDTEKLFIDALEIVKKDKTMVFIGEIAEKQNTYRQLYDYLIDKYKNNSVFATIKKEISNILESRIVKGAINGDLNPTMVIFTLKNNHGWVDASKVENEIKGGLNISPKEWS